MNNATGYSDVQWAWSGVLFVVAVVVMFWWNSDSDDKAYSSKPTDRAVRAHVTVSGTNMLRDFLKDGDSAKVSGVMAFVSSGMACGRVNAKNGFGAYTGEQGFIVLTESRTVILERGAPQAILDSWPSACK